MNDAIWSDREWSRGVVRRLLGPKYKPTSIAPEKTNYTRLSAKTLLSRSGIDSKTEETERRLSTADSTSEVSSPRTCSVEVPGDVREPRNDAPSDDKLPALAVESIDTLEELLDWTLLCATASSTFLLDAQGFVVERVGALEFERAEATGTQVLLAMERLGKAELTETPLRSLNVEFDDHWLTAIPLPAGHSEIYTLCLVTGAAVSPARIRHIAASVSEVIVRV